MKYKHLRYDIRGGVSKVKSRLAIAVSAAVLASSGLGLSLVFSGAANALPGNFSNGSFETGADPGTYTTLNSVDSTSIPGWTVESGSVDYIGSYWTASDGARSIDLSGNEAGAISQTFHTVPGQSYIVTFDMAGNTDGGTQPKVLSVDTGAGGTNYSFDSSGKSTSAMGWAHETYGFTAIANSTKLRFTSDETSPFGPALDNVAVSTVQKDFNNNLNKSQCGVTKSSKKVVDVNFKLINDYDSGTGGNNWANDTINRNLRIWQLSSGSYCALTTDQGSFVTMAGLSPNKTDLHMGSGIKGDMDGGKITGVFTGSLDGHTYKTHGYLGTFNLDCNQNASGCSQFPTASSFVTSYNGDLQWWGWEYNTCSNGSWINSSDANLGDITGTAPAHQGKCQDGDKHQHDHDKYNDGDRDNGRGRHCGPKF